MLTLRSEAALNARFATSPLWETAAALRLLAVRRHALHGRWLAMAAGALRENGVRLPTLDLLVPPTGHMADLLTPAPRKRSSAFAEEVARVGSIPVETVSTDLEHLLASARSARRVEGLRRLLEDPASARSRAVEEVQAFWHVAVQPFWQRLQSLADADIAHRGRRVADVGTSAALSELHPNLDVDGDRVAVRTACLDDPLAARRDELVLVPTSFTWPDPLVLNHPGDPLTIAYAPRGVGVLWQQRASVDGLSELLGATRAQALRMLDIPMTTTQLSKQLALTPPTINEHLRILARAGVVMTRRQGRQVYYERTALGDDLLAAGDPPAAGLDEAAIA